MLTLQNGWPRVLTLNGLGGRRSFPPRKEGKPDPSRLIVGLYIPCKFNFRPELMRISHSENRALDYLMMPATSAVPFFCVSRVQRLAFFRVIGAYSLHFEHKKIMLFILQAWFKHWHFRIWKVLCIYNFKVFVLRRFSYLYCNHDLHIKLFAVCRLQKTIFYNQETLPSLFFCTWN